MIQKNEDELKIDALTKREMEVLKEMAVGKFNSCLLYTSHSLRAQADKAEYSMEMRKTLQNTDHLTIRQGEVSEIVTDENNNICLLYTSTCTVILLVILGDLLDAVDDSRVVSAAQKLADYIK